MVSTRRPYVTFIRSRGCPFKCTFCGVNASVYVYGREFLLNENNNSVLSDRSMIYEMSEWSAFDIDSEFDFKFVEYLVSKNIVSL